MPERYEIDDPEIKSLLLTIGRDLKDKMPEGWGFTLLIFSFGPGGSMFYLSSAEREDMITAMLEFVKKQVS